MNLAAWWHAFWLATNNGNWWNVAEGITVPTIPLAAWAELKHRATKRLAQQHRDEQAAEHAENMRHHAHLRAHLNIPHPDQEAP